MKLLSRNLLLLLIWLPACALAALPVVAPDTPMAPPVQSEQGMQMVRLPLQQITGQPGRLSLRGTDGVVEVHFGLSNDQLVSQATLHLRYSYSPSLIPEQSHIKVLLNDELIGVLPVTRQGAGQLLSSDITVDPRLLVEFNRLAFEFVGHIASDCEDPQSSSLWAAIDGNSELELQLRSLPIRPDLGLLPEPFFNRGNAGRLVLPVTFAATPDQDTLRAAGIVASWFGMLADWRGARFPVHVGGLPQPGHAIVFATQATRPAWLDPTLRIDGPMLAEMINPADGYSPLLLVLGRNGQELTTAALALALGHAALSGTRASITSVTDTGPRVAYDAPRWVRMDRPMKFGELVDSPQDLERSGLQPAPVNVPLRMPPDLFAWHSRGIPLNLRFRFTPVGHDDESRLTISANDQFVQAFNLKSSDGRVQHPVRLALNDHGLFDDGRSLFLPAYKLGTKNRLQFAFSYHRRGLCEDTQPGGTRSAVDADSTIDFTGFLHYTELPNLNYFASLGFPFTRYADLSQTVIVLPTHPAAAHIEAMLDLLAHLSASTGYPATRFRLTGPDDTPALADADLIVIGSSLHDGLLARWNSHLPANLSTSARRISQPRQEPNDTYDWFELGARPDPAPQSQVRLAANGPLALLTGFESPLTPHRSVVALVASSPDQLGLILNALDTPGQQQAIQGSEAFFHTDRIDSYLTGQLYTTGQLPWWVRLWLWLSNHPVLLVIFALLTILTAAASLRKALAGIARRRLEE